MKLLYAFLCVSLCVTNNAVCMKRSHEENGREEDSKRLRLDSSLDGLNGAAAMETAEDARAVDLSEVTAVALPDQDGNEKCEEEGSSADTVAGLKREREVQRLSLIDRELLRAIESGDLQRVKDAIGKGARVDMSECIDCGTTALLEAINQKANDIVKFLIEIGVDVNGCDGSGFSPLIVAANEGRLTYVQWLIDAGADYNQRDPENRETLLHIIAMKEGALELVRKLVIEYKMNIYARDNEECTPADAALEVGNIPSYNFLMKVATRNERRVAVPVLVDDLRMPVVLADIISDYL